MCFLSHLNYCCLDIDNFLSNPCQNGAACSEAVASFTSTFSADFERKTSGPDKDKQVLDCKCMRMNLKSCLQHYKIDGCHFTFLRFPYPLCSHWRCECFATNAVFLLFLEKISSIYSTFTTYFRFIISKPLESFSFHWHFISFLINNRNFKGCWNGELV